MKIIAFLKKNLLPVIAAVHVLICVILVIWWNAPKVFLKHVEPAEISYIRVVNGSTGSSFYIEDQNEVSHILSNIQSVKVCKESWSRDIDGFLFRLSFYNTEGKLIDTFILNKDGLRDDPFFYEIKEGIPCIDYLWGLENGLIES